MLLETITFNSTVGFPISLVLWKLDIQNFLGHQDQLNPSQGRPLNACPKLNNNKNLKLLMSAEVADNPCMVAGSGRRTL